MEETKQLSKVENRKGKIKWPKVNLSLWLCVLVVACPVLDMTSFLFRNTFSTFFSPSTVLRPVIPIIALLILFFTTKQKVKILIAGLIYGGYAVLHLIVFQSLQTQISYSNAIHEAQYLVNYTFMIINLFLFCTVFKKEEDTTVLKKSVLLAITIYLISLFLSILTKTSSSTYLEGIGYKGWYESGNSLGAILILSLFILLPMIKEKKFRIWVISIILSMGIFLTLLLGTRVGLFGFILVVVGYIIVQIGYSFFHKIKVNSKILIICSLFLVALVIAVVLVGSHTIQRRKQLAKEQTEIIDEVTGQQAYITGDLTKLKNAILEGKVSSTYLPKPEQQAILDLNEYAVSHKLENNDMRSQQLIYHCYLVKNQQNLPALLFGNGYLNPYMELVLEMEIPAFLFNFGVLGFLLYFAPFLMLFVYGCYILIKKHTKIEVEYIMTLAGCGFTFVLSFFSGYTFFNSSTMIMIIVLNALLLHQIQKIKNRK